MVITRDPEPGRSLPHPRPISPLRPSSECLRLGPDAAGKPASKIESFVEFPLHSLNMYPHTSAHLCPPGGTGDASGIAETGPEHLYDLFGAAVHHGSIQNGHYTTFVRRHASWFHCDDSAVTLAMPHVVRACQGYLLFYIRKKVL